MSWEPKRNLHYKIWSKPSDNGLQFAATYAVDSQPDNPCGLQNIKWKPLVNAHNYLRSFGSAEEAEKAVVEHLVGNPKEWHHVWTEADPTVHQLNPDNFRDGDPPPSFDGVRLWAV
jgi:hypothetical protein